EEETMNFNLSTTNSSRISSSLRWLHRFSAASPPSWMRASAPMSLPFLNLQFLSITALTSTCSLSLRLIFFMQYCDDIFEPKLEELINQLR
ncbi:unnamed protein product, partial [Thlaspi arvense]